MLSLTGASLLYHTFPRVSLLISRSRSLALFPVPQTHIWALISQHSSLRPQHFLQLSTEWKQWLTRRDDERESAWRWDRKKGRLNPSRPQRPSFFFFFFWPTTHYIRSKFPCEVEKRICCNVFQISTEKRAPNLSHMFLYSWEQLRRERKWSMSSNPETNRDAPLKFDYFLSLSPVAGEEVFLLCFISHLHIFRPDITECPPAERKIRLSLKKKKKKKVQSVLVTLTAEKKARKDFNRHALKTNLPESRMLYLCRFVTDKHVCWAVWRQLTWN